MKIETRNCLFFTDGKDRIQKSASANQPENTFAAELGKDLHTCGRTFEVADQIQPAH